MRAWRQFLLQGGSLHERRRFNTALGHLRAGARLQCMCLTAKGQQCKNKAKEGTIYCGRHQTCKRPMEDAEIQTVKMEETTGNPVAKQCTRRKGRCQVLRPGEDVADDCEFNMGSGRCRSAKKIKKEKPVKKKKSIPPPPSYMNTLSGGDLKQRIQELERSSDNRYEYLKIQIKNLEQKMRNFVSDALKYRDTNDDYWSILQKHINFTYNEHITKFNKHITKLENLENRFDTLIEGPDGPVRGNI